MFRSSDCHKYSLGNVELVTHSLPDLLQTVVVKIREEEGRTRPRATLGSLLGTKSIILLKAFTV